MRLTLMFMFLIIQPAFAVAVVMPSGWSKVGEANLKVLWFDIYHAELFAPEGRFKGLSEPLLLTLNYKRDIPLEQLIDETKEELSKFTVQGNAVSWSQTLEGFWPSVNKGDQIAFWADATGAGHFFYNRDWIGSLKEPEFSYAFISIWLSDKSSYPKLAKKLRGEPKDETMD